ncbi:hypothetical protein HPP92_009158 [Vanilla planifolia]|uniref:Exoribonuclease phosphorolytic domain-containing protein n=1 Tax=Vanilla planifolia TaxID=51239 RepID=A0A835V2L3_VANPL|nr:hypothetical protein HPP92_009158 [Vanilla planifolia]
MLLYLRTRSACINAATLALADAGIPMRDIVTSCCAGYLCSTPLLDLNYVEDSAGGPDVTVGMLVRMDKVTLLQMDAKLPIEIFENVMQLAIEGCKAIGQYIREVRKVFFFSCFFLCLFEPSLPKLSGTFREHKETRVHERQLEY